jgi:hypothetical protein
MAPDAQTIPQAPQFAGSVIGFTHAPAQPNLEPEQLDLQLPTSQRRP